MSDADRLAQVIAAEVERLRDASYTGKLTVEINFNQGGVTRAITSESRRLLIKHAARS